MNPPCQGRDLCLLTGDDIGQVIHRTDQMGHLFFELIHEGTLQLARLPSS